MTPKIFYTPKSGPPAPQPMKCEELDEPYPSNYLLAYPVRLPVHEPHTKLERSMGCCMPKCRGGGFQEREVIVGSQKTLEMSPGRPFAIVNPGQGAVGEWTHKVRGTRGHPAGGSPVQPISAEAKPNSARSQDVLGCRQIWCAPLPAVDAETSTNLQAETSRQKCTRGWKCAVIRSGPS